MTVDDQAGNPVLSITLAENAFHGIWLERGTRKMAPRPWIKVTMAKEGPAMRDILQGRTIGITT